MPTLEMSSAFSTGYVTRMLGKSSGIYGGATPATSPLMSQCTGGSYGQVGTNMILMILKGTVPADFSTLTSLSVRSADVLMTFSTIAGDFTPAIANVNPGIISTIYRASAAAGTATWFWWVTRQIGDGAGSVYTQYTTPINQMFGTVGITGGGADLEIPDTNIVSGLPYRITNLRLNFPTTWTY